MSGLLNILFQRLQIWDPDCVRRGRWRSTAGAKVRTCHVDNFLLKLLKTAAEWRRAGPSAAKTFDYLLISVLASISAWKVSSYIYTRE